MEQHIHPSDRLSDAQQDQRSHKQALRRQMSDLREQLDRAQVTAWSETMGRQLLSSGLFNQILLSRPERGEAPGIGCFVAMRQEVDFQSVWPIFRDAGFRLCFPRMIRLHGQADLEFLAIPEQADPEAFLVRSHFGVYEPASRIDRPELTPCDPDLILLPGLAFDRHGNRLGWGQGYYDHYLARRQAQSPANRPILVGVAYPFQIHHQIPAGDFDIPVDYLLTPDGLDPVKPL